MVESQNYELCQLRSGILTKPRWVERLFNSGRLFYPYFTAQIIIQSLLETIYLVRRKLLEIQIFYLSRNVLETRNNHIKGRSNVKHSLENNIFLPLQQCRPRISFCCTCYNQSDSPVHRHRQGLQDDGIIEGGAWTKGFTPLSASCSRFIDGRQRLFFISPNAHSGKCAALSSFDSLSLQGPIGCGPLNGKPPNFYWLRIYFGIRNREDLWAWNKTSPVNVKRRIWNSQKRAPWCKWTSFLSLWGQNVDDMLKWPTKVGMPHSIQPNSWKKALRHQTGATLLVSFGKWIPDFVHRWLKSQIASIFSVVLLS